MDLECGLFESVSVCVKGEGLDSVPLRPDTLQRGERSNRC